jgi:hypothetical protein
MERGIGGRIEDAFAAAKAAGEAAFITFVTAGYPTAKGKSSSLHCLDIAVRLFCSISLSTPQCKTLPLFFWLCKRAVRPSSN